MHSQPNLQRSSRAPPTPPADFPPAFVSTAGPRDSWIRLGGQAPAQPTLSGPKKAGPVSASGHSCCLSSVDRGWGPQQGPPGLAEPGPASLAHTDCPACLVGKGWPRGAPTPRGHQPESRLFPAPSAKGGSLIQLPLSQPTLIWFRGSPSSLFSLMLQGRSHGVLAEGQGLDQPRATPHPSTAERSILWSIPELPGFWTSHFMLKYILRPFCVGVSVTQPPKHSAGTAENTVGPRGEGGRTLHIRAGTT